MKVKVRRHNGVDWRREWQAAHGQTRSLHPVPKETNFGGQFQPRISTQFHLLREWADCEADLEPPASLTEAECAELIGDYAEWIG